MITRMMIRYLLDNGFRNKRVLADEFGIPYRKLLGVYGTRPERKTAMVVTKGACALHPWRIDVNASDALLTLVMIVLVARRAREGETMDGLLRHTMGY